MDIKASDVKALREKTGAGMMECKKALVEANGNADEAEKILKEKGLAAMAKRAERATSEGRLFIRQDGNKVAVIEVTCETDFVAKNSDFIAVGEKMLDVTLAKGYTKVEPEHEELLEPLKVSIRENMKVAKVEVIDVPATATASFYVHSDFKTGAVVVIDGSTADEVKTFAKDCCLHIAAFTPSYFSKNDVPESYIAEQKEIFKALIDQDEKLAGKPDNVKAGALQGKVNKHLAEICFEDQMFVKDDKKSVSAKLAEVGKSVGATLKFATAKLFVLGK
ncbi:MAG: translation elongation factor Ts [Treponema sp.]|nr:translation elongation factor Ts [Spirochaetia bacterium]MDD6295479.1 translation elongation factor Ts [Treponema sp.]MDD7450819.1 translation elongation factor Ts [Treponema sp.]MDY2924328.1 translation elongation factor Ts [Treponema sp.]MDY5683183.1 translation elongation factor Ts [Treponema sp.]